MYLSRSIKLLECPYLVDEFVGLKPHDKVSADVMNKILHNLEIIKPGLKVDKERDVKSLYIEAICFYTFLDG